MAYEDDFDWRACGALQLFQLKIFFDDQLLDSNFRSIFRLEDWRTYFLNANFVPFLHGGGSYNSRPTRIFLQILGSGAKLVPKEHYYENFFDTKQFNKN